MEWVFVGLSQKYVLKKISFIKCNVGDGNLENIFQRWMQLIQFLVVCRQKSNNDV